MRGSAVQVRPLLPVTPDLATRGQADRCRVSKPASRHATTPDRLQPDRHKAEAVCKKIKGSKCDAVNTYSSSCTNGHCYDASGKKHHSLKGY